MRVLFKLLFIMFEKKVCLAPASSTLAVDFLQHDFCLPFFLQNFTGEISSITFSNFELNESRRRSTGPACVHSFFLPASLNKT